MKIAYKKAQNTAEYAILIALVIGAAIAMQTYVKRSWQGGVKFAVDKLQKEGSTAPQYEPYYLKSEYVSDELAYTDTEETKTGGKVVRTTGSSAAPHTTTRSGYQEIKAAVAR